MVYYLLPMEGQVQGSIVWSFIGTCTDQDLSYCTSDNCPWTLIRKMTGML